MRIFILTGLLAVLSGCSTYTDRTSPCIGRNSNPVVSRAAASPVLSFTPAVNGHVADHDCVFRPIGAGA